MNPKKKQSSMFAIINEPKEKQLLMILQRNSLKILPIKHCICRGTYIKEMK